MNILSQGLFLKVLFLWLLHASVQINHARGFVHENVAAASYHHNPKRVFSTLDNTDIAATAPSSDPSSPSTCTTIKLATLRVHGPDANGIVAAFSQLLYGHGCGIVDSEQHTDHSEKIFFQRIHFDYTNLFTDQVALQHGIQEVCQRFQMKYQLHWNDQKKRIAVMVSKYDHCLWELLLRHRAGELNTGEICLVISNHPDLEDVAKSFDVPFYFFQTTKDTKQQVEEQELKLLEENNVDLVVLARYMQIVSDEFCQAYPVINIHHSFLPAFIGGKPYHRAYARGVKVEWKELQTTFRLKGPHMC
jgi:formyltetrahydrofolate deformylase